MFAGVIKALSCSRRRLRPTRLVAVVCAVSILSAGLAHSVHQSNELMPIVAMQSDANATNDLPDAAKKSPVVIEHCFGCLVIVLADLAQPFVPHRLATDLPMRRVDEKRPHSPAVEIPPPIATI